MNAFLRNEIDGQLVADSLFGGHVFVPNEHAEAVERVHAATALYTQPKIVETLLDRIDWPHGDRRLIDTSCGDGVFLGSALARLLRTAPAISDDRIVHIIAGWEIHPGAADQARNRISDLLVARGRSRSRARIAAAHIVRNADFITDGPDNGERYDYIVGNPPYLRRLNLPATLRRLYDANVPDYAQADLLHSFMDRAANLLTPTGQLALVTADRWLFNSSAARLRAVLGRRLTINHLVRLDASTAFYQPKLRRSGSRPRVHPVAILLGRDQGGIPLGNEAVYPGVTAHAPGPTLADVARVAIGPWLGKTGIFVVDAATAAELPPESLVPAVETRDLLTDGTLREPSLYAIRTTAAAPAATIRAHLERQLPRLAARGRRTPYWLPPESWNDEWLTQERLAVPCIARSIRVVRIPPGVLPISHNVTVIGAGSQSLDEIEAELMSANAQTFIKSRAARIEGGYLRITTSLLKTLPISLPSLDIRKSATVDVISHINARS